jgi:hypothetical protein
LSERLPQITLLALLLLWLLIAVPGLANRYAKWTETKNLLGGRSLEERSALLDNPAVPVARKIAGIVPPRGCVTVLAYAGPSAIDYYRARLSYLLYPRRVGVFADAAGSVPDCEFLAVFRDSRKNLASAPFQGSWDEAGLQRRLETLEAVSTDGPVRLYRVP